MNVDDFPGVTLAMKYKRPATQRVARSIKLEGNKRGVAVHLYPHLLRHEVQVRRSAGLFPTCLKNRLETLLDLLPPIESADTWSFWNVWVKDRHLVCQRHPKFVPIKIIEGGDETLEGQFYILARLGVVDNGIECEPQNSEEYQRYFHIKRFSSDLFLRSRRTTLDGTRKSRVLRFP